MPVHVLVRDYPESLAPLLARGVDFDRMGACPVGEFADPGLLAELEEAVAWRPPARRSARVGQDGTCAELEEA